LGVTPVHRGAAARVPTTAAVPAVVAGNEERNVASIHVDEPTVGVQELPAVDVVDDDDRIAVDEREVVAVEVVDADRQIAVRRVPEAADTVETKAEIRATRVRLRGLARIILRLQRRAAEIERPLHLSTEAEVLQARLTLEPREARIRSRPRTVPVGPQAEHL